MSSPSPISCFNCGYCIEGLEEEARCPECAFPIRSTLASHERIAAALFDPALAASRFSLLGAFQLVAALWVCLIPLQFLRLNGIFWKYPTYVVYSAIGAALVLWLCIQCTWHFIALLFTTASAPFAAKFLKACSASASLGLILGGGLTLAVSQGAASQGSVLLPTALLLFAALASFIGTVPAGTLSLHIIRTLPLSARANLIDINWLSLMFTFCSVAGAFLSFIISPWLCLLIPLAPALSSFRSFTLSRRIHAAIGKRT